jgi:hypothetical protein
MGYPFFGGVDHDVVLPAVAMLALAGPSRRRKCPDVASAKSGIESFSRERGLVLCSELQSARYRRRERAHSSIPSNLYAAARGLALQRRW